MGNYLLFLKFEKIFKMKQKVIVILAFLMIGASQLFSQRNVSDDIISTPYIGLHYGANIPGKDYADRFGFTNHLGGIIGYKTNMNWIFAIDGNFMFGQAVNEPFLLDNISDNQGVVINSSGSPAEVLFFQRGFNVNGAIGYIFPGTGHNPNSGVMLKIGAGYMQHKIRIESQEDEVPQIENDYLQGYDRLTAGLNTTQFIGYSFMANGGVYNFYTGFYFVQGFTYNKRDLFWDRPNYEVPKGQRQDFQFGIRFGWMVPTYKRQPKDFYFN